MKLLFITAQTANTQAALNTQRTQSLAYATQQPIEQVGRGHIMAMFAVRFMEITQAHG